MFKIGKVSFSCLPKCGHSSLNYFINTNRKLLEKINKEINILILRDPTERLISFYCDKILNLSYNAEDKIDNVPFKIQNDIGINIDYNNSSFQDFINILCKINLNSCDPHLKRQITIYNKDINYDLIINVKDFNSTFINYFKKIDKNFIFNPNKKQKNKTIRIETNINVSNYNINDFKVMNGVPSNNSLFLNDSIIYKINELFNEDILLYNKLIIN